MSAYGYGLVIDDRHGTLNDSKRSRISDCRCSRTSHGWCSRLRDDWCGVVSDSSLSAVNDGSRSRVCGHKRKWVGNKGGIKTRDTRPDCRSYGWSNCQSEMMLFNRLRWNKRGFVWVTMASIWAGECDSGRCRWCQRRSFQSVPFGFLGGVLGMFQFRWVAIWRRGELANQWVVFQQGVKIP